MDKQEIIDSLPSKTPLLKSYFKGESATPVSTLTIRDVLVEAAANKPDHVIYRIPEYNDAITIKTLLDKSEKFSRALLSRGIRKGDVVMALGVPTCDLYVMFQGTVGIGARFMSSFLLNPKEGVVEPMEESRPKLVLLGYEMDFFLGTIKDYNSRASEKMEIILYLKEDNTNSVGPSSYKDFLISGSSVSDKELEQAQNLTTCDDTALCQCTSGTTGKFKLGLINHRCLVNVGIFGHARKNPNHQRKIIGFSNSMLGDLMPLLDSFSLLCNWMFELQGVVYPTTVLNDPSTLLQFIQDERIESLEAFPYILTPLINKPIVDQYDLSRWQAGFLVGQAIDRKSRQWIHERMPYYMVGYGCTEFLAGTGTSPENTDTEKFLSTVGYPYPHIEVKPFLFINHIISWYSSSYSHNSLVIGQVTKMLTRAGKVFGPSFPVSYRYSINTAKSRCLHIAAYTVILIHFNKLKIIDKQNEIVDVGKIGEVCLRGWSAINGYQQNGKLIDATDDDGWVLNGDLAKMDSTGHVIFIGRKSECVRFKKEADYIHPREIENVVKEHPEVQDAVVVGIPDNTEGDTICLCVVQKENSKLQVKDLEVFCKSRLYERDLPEFYFIFKFFPTVGMRRKISREMIKNEVLQRLRDRQFNLTNTI